MRVRVNSIYIFVATGMDIYDPATREAVEDGTEVRVINKFGCPRANAMGQCYIENKETQEFYGMVNTNSLSKKE